MTIVLIDEFGWVDDSGCKTGAHDDVIALVDAVTAADAVVLGTLPEATGRRPGDSELLRAAIRKTPLFIVGGPDQRLSDGRTVEAGFALTDYDRLVVTEPGHASGSARHIVAPDTDRDTLIRLAREELEGTDLPPYLDLSPILATTYAGQPASRDAPQLGSRKASKIVHMEQIQALEKAMQSALERDGLASRPSLLDFGCGGGRLYPQCMPRTRYCGADRDPKALAAARAMHPSGRFVEADTLETSEPSFDILLSVNVLQHCAIEERRALYALWSKLIQYGGSLILLENALPSETTGIHAVSIEEIILDLGRAFGGSIDVDTFQTISYPPYDGMSPSVLVNLIKYS